MPSERPLIRLLELFQLLTKNIGPLLTAIGPILELFKNAGPFLETIATFWPKLKEIIDLFSKLTPQELQAVQALTQLDEGQRDRAIEQLKMASDQADVLQIVSDAGAQP